MIRDLGLESFHSVLVAAVEEILLTKRELDCFIQARTDTKFAVKNSASVYHYKATKEESAIEQLQKAHTNSFRAYLHALKSVAVVIPHASTGTGPGTGTEMEGVSSVLSSLTSSERTFVNTVRDALCRVVMYVLYEPVSQVLIQRMPTGSGPGSWSGFDLSRVGLTSGSSAQQESGGEAVGLIDGYRDVSYTLLHPLYW